MIEDIEIVEIPVCGNCNIKIQRGVIICPGCNKKDPTIKYEHLAVYVPPFSFDSQGNLYIKDADTLNV